MNPILIKGAKLLLTNSTARKGAKFLLESAFNSVTKIFSQNMSLEEVSEKYSPKLKNIVEQCQREGLSYQAGRFKIFYLDDKSFALNFELYFTDSDGKWLNAENTSSALDSEKWLSLSARIYLREKKRKNFFIRFLKFREMIYIKFPKKISDKVVDKVEQRIKQTAADVKNKISETVSNVAAEISAIEEERKRKNLETMNRIRFNANHLSDAQLRTLINDSSIDKFKRIGYAAAFADRYSDGRD